MNAKSRSDRPISLSDVEDPRTHSLPSEIRDFLGTEYGHLLTALGDLLEVHSALAGSPDLTDSLPLLQAQYDQFRSLSKKMEEERDRVYAQFVALADSLPHKKVEGLYTRVTPSPRESLSRAKLLEYVTVEVLEECTERKEVKAYYKIAPVGGEEGEEE